MNRNCLVVILTLGLVALCPVLRAQDQEPSIDSMVEMVRAGMQAEKAAIITTNMKLSDKDGAAFWPIYRQYEHERSIVGDDRVSVIKEYSAKYRSSPMRMPKQWRNECSSTTPALLR